LLASLHNHTNSDPNDPIRYSDKELIDHAHEKNFQILAITCHGKWIGSLDLIAYAKSKNILLLPGVEISIRNRHIVILNATQEAEKIRNFKELKEYKKSHPESFIIAAHPYFPGLNMINDMIEKNISCFDGIEFSWWHSDLIDFNKKGERLAKKNNLPFIGTSDTHNMKNFGITYCEIETSILSTENIFEALRENKLKNISKTLKTWQMFLMPFIAIRDKLWLTKETWKKFARTKLKR
jgi:hypothetical protein